MMGGTRNKEEGASSCHEIPWIEEYVAAAFKLWNVDVDLTISASFFVGWYNHF